MILPLFVLASVLVIFRKKWEFSFSRLKHIFSELFVKGIVALYLKAVISLLIFYDSLFIYHSYRRKKGVARLVMSEITMYCLYVLV